VYLALSVVVQRDLVRGGLGTRIYHQNMLGQDCLLHAWTLAWDQHALATAPSNLLDANIFHPERGTLLYSDHLLGLALLTAPLRLATDAPLLVHNLLVVAAPALDALALYALVAALTGNAVAAFVGGLVYGFAPLRFAADACQIQMTAAWWLPLMLLGGLRAVRGSRRWGIVAGCALLGQGLSGIYLTAYFLPFLAIAHVVWWWRHPFARARGGWTALVASEAGAALLLLPTALAYREVQAHLNLSRSPFLNAILSLHWSQLGDHVPAIGLGLLAVLAVVRRRDLPPAFRAEHGLFLTILLGAILFGLGPAMPLPFGLGTIPGPYRLLVELPGFTALRVPARMLHVSLLGASVLAAGGVLVLQQVARRRPVSIALAALIALGIESPPRALRTDPMLAPARMDPVYRWLARQPPTVIVELPVDPFLLGGIVRQYASTLHWQPSLTGVSGIQPTMYPYMARRLEGFPAPGVIADLVALGVEHAIVHERRVPPAMRTALDAAEREGRLLKRRWASDGAVVYSLRPSLEPSTVRPAGHALERRGWRVTATASGGLAGRVADEDPATAWRPWADLDASVQRAWYEATPLLDRWKAFLDTVPATLTIDLGGPTRVTGVRLALGGSDPMMLPELRLGVSADADTWTTLPVRPFPDVRALVRHAARMPVAAVLPTPTLVRYVRIEVGAFDASVGDVEVYGDASRDVGAAGRRRRALRESYGTTRGSPNPVRSARAGVPGGLVTRSTSSTSVPAQRVRSTSTSVQ
jgi:hypothetical protein